MHNKNDKRLLKEGSWGYEPCESDGSLDLIAIYADKADKLLQDIIKQEHSDKWHKIALLEFIMDGYLSNKYGESNISRFMISEYKKSLEEAEKDTEWINDWHEPDKMRNSLKERKKKLNKYIDAYNKYNSNDKMEKMKINEGKLNKIIKAILKEYLDYNDNDLGIDPEMDAMDVADAEYDTNMDKFMHDDPEGYAEQTGMPIERVYAELDRKYSNNFDDDMPFESKKVNKKTISESAIRDVVKKTIMEIFDQDRTGEWRENQLRGYLNRSDDRGTVSVNGTAIYYDQNGENYKELPFDMEVEVPGTIEGERDEDGNYSSWFTPSDESDVRDEIMSNIQWSIEENGIIYNLEDIEIDSIN